MTNPQPTHWSKVNRVAILNEATAVIYRKYSGPRWRTVIHTYRLTPASAARVRRLDLPRLLGVR